MTEQWYQTTGKEHLRNFFNMIERAVREGKKRGLKMSDDIDASQLIRIYRGDNNVLTDDEVVKARKLYAEGWRAVDIARLLGTDDSLHAILKNKVRKNVRVKARDEHAL